MELNKASLSVGVRIHISELVKLSSGPRHGRCLGVGLAIVLEHT